MVRKVLLSFMIIFVFNIWFFLLLMFPLQYVSRTSGCKPHAAILGVYCGQKPRVSPFSRLLRQAAGTYRGANSNLAQTPHRHIELLKK